MKTYIVGNWKMNQTLLEIRDFFSQINSYKEEFLCETYVAPQFIHLGLALELSKEKGRVKIGAQNCGPKEKGAFTGEVSPVALAELGTHFVIIGHSERRHHFHEDNELLRKRTLCALQSGLEVIFCVGETLQEREKGEAMGVVEAQIQQGLKDIPPVFKEKILIAYEPVWAIGTGVTATPLQAQEMHHHIRNLLMKMNFPKGETIPILYGGSVNPSNIRELLDMKDIDGALVGGASLLPNEYIKLCEGSRNF